MAIYVNAYLCRYVKICHICVNVRSSSVCQQTPWSNEHHLTGTQLSKPDFCWTRPGEVCILLFMTHTHSHAHALAHAHTYMHTHDTHTHALTHIFGCLFYDNTHIRYELGSIFHWVISHLCVWLSTAARGGRSLTPALTTCRRSRTTSVS